MENTLHPIMADALGGLANMHKTVAAATFYRAQLGRRRTFMSASDAQAYDKGFSEYPALPDSIGTPQAQGYFDAEQVEQELHDAVHWGRRK